jgi:hypothetical protein
MQTARKEIFDAAALYNATAAVAESAPRIKEVEARLCALRDAYRTLSRQLRHLDSDHVE